MPNWVSNSLTISGKVADLESFIEKATAVSPLRESYPKDEQDDLKPKFSFSNFVAPPQESLDSGEYHATHGWSGGEKSGNTPNNWYNFNTREWGTKWDACDPEVEDINTTAESVRVRFQTAWSPPQGVFGAMAEQHPELTFKIYSEEEQGWAVEYVGEDGCLEIEKEWDIPNSHADYVERDREEDCNCNWGADKEDWYDDCPGKRTIFARVTRVYELTASDLEQARTEVFEMETGAKPFPEPQSDYGVTEFVDEDGSPIIEEQV